MGYIYSVFETSWGWCGAVAGEKGLIRIVLPLPEKEEIIARIYLLSGGRLIKRGKIEEAEERIKKYFLGENPDLNVPLDFSCSTFFRKQVWEYVRSIPYGKVETYSKIGERIGNPKACRAVGGALSSNPFPILVPCHRVVGTDRGLGGFSAPEGIKLKIRMLKLEGIRFDCRGKVLVGNK